MNNEHVKYKDEVIITIELSGSEKECFIIAFPKGEYGKYIALLPKENLESGEILLFKFIENDVPEIIGIEDDAEYEYADYLLQEIIDDSAYLSLIERYNNI